jgi:hypothetical protein
MNAAHLVLAAATWPSGSGLGARLAVDSLLTYCSLRVFSSGLFDAPQLRRGKMMQFYRAEMAQADGGRLHHLNVGSLQG